LNAGGRGFEAHRRYKRKVRAGDESKWSNGRPFGEPVPLEARKAKEVDGRSLIGG
jgi:hypothetical protein